MSNFPISEFSAFIEANQLFTQGERLLLAVSGGKDSVFMAHLFAAYGVNFGIAHCNFKLRGSDSDEDQAFVEALADHIQAPFFTVEFDTKAYAKQHNISTQMAARDLRYTWFEHIRTTHQFDKIAIAQHQTDVTETILLNLIRGTGIAGLHGIFPKRNQIIRPLLFLDEPTIQRLVTQNAITYREDKSNSSLSYKRNFLRHKVLPLLRTLNPEVDRTFSKNAAHIRAIEPLLEGCIQGLREDLLIQTEQGIRINKNAFLEINNPHILYEILMPYGFKLDVLQDLLKQSTIPGKQFHSATHTLYVDRAHYYLKATQYRSDSVHLVQTLPARICFSGKTYQLHLSDTVLIDKTKNLVQIDAELLDFPLQLRSWKQGDRFQPLGMRGKKKISDFYIQHKIPEPQKASIPLLINGDQTILSVGILQIHDAYKITKNTKKVLIFEVL